MKLVLSELDYQGKNEKDEVKVMIQSNTITKIYSRNDAQGR